MSVEGGAMIPLGDIVEAAEALRVLADRRDDDARWEEMATPTLWTAGHTLEHIVDALVFYAGQVARRADKRLPVMRDGRTAPPSEHLDNVFTAAALLTGQLRDLGEGRAWHPSGLADAAGWAGMAVTEILVHGSDVARALQIELVLPSEVCRRAIARVFPWVDGTMAPPDELLLAVTGRGTCSGIPSDPHWWWQSAPLAEWDGKPRQRDVSTGWR